MRRGRSILILAAVTAVAVGAVLSVDRGSNMVEGSGELVFPALLGRVNDVARVRVTGNEGAFTLARDGEAWVVEEKERYPAEPDRMHTLILGAAGLRRVEPKTSNPERYPQLRLEDPAGEDARSARFVLEDASGAELARWVLGDRRPSKSDPGRTELYIRTGDDPQAWLVEGSLPGGRTIIDWVDRLVARIDRERLRAVEVVHADGAVVAVHRSRPTDVDFTLQGGVPEGREIDAQYRIDDIGRVLEELRFEDVVPASELDFSGAVDKRLEITTFDGLRIRMETVMRDGAAFARLRAEADETLVEVVAEASGTSGSDAGAKAGGMGDAMTEGEAGAKTEGTAGAKTGGEADAEPEDAAGGPLHTLEEVRAEAGTLNARWTGWAYELPSFKRDYIARRVDELTRPLEDTSGAQEASGN